MDKQAVRRKILQGTLAAPVVLTVSSASAQAITSFGKCLSNLARRQPTNVFTTSADTWFRSQVRVVRIMRGSQSLGTFYFDPKLGRYVDVVRYTVFTGFAGATPSRPYWLEAAGSRWALVYFDPISAAPYTDGTGTTIVTTQKPSGYLATSISCYGSFTRRV
jgi:hypothetical protein